MVKIHLYKPEIRKICTNRHLIVEDVYGKLKEKFPKVGISTVYRNLEEMVKDGEVRKLKILGGKGVYETNIGNHAHLIDNKTGRIIDLDLANANFSFIPSNFDVDNVDVSVYGSFK